MAICPFAVQKPFSGSSGSYTGGPFKIVHHTTEGGSAAGAFGAYRANRSDPHFTVDGTTIYQHIDTDVAARALRNPPGGVQTNRDSAVQIEVVGFAHRPKAKDTLRNVARLCRWIEATHGVPRAWPNGPPKQAENGRDPGGHNRDARAWDTKGGHYGHSQVPENTHWDPGYTADEARFVLTYDPADLTAGEPSWAQALPETDPGLTGDTTRMPDHHHVDDAGSGPGEDGVSTLGTGRAGAIASRTVGPQTRRMTRPRSGVAAAGSDEGFVLAATAAALGIAAAILLARRPIDRNDSGLTPGHAGDETNPDMGSILRGPNWTPNDLRQQYENTDSEGWLPFFEDAGERYGFDPALLLAVASRETNIRQIVGDGGHGRGIMQIDDRYHIAFVQSGRWRDPRENILQGAAILAKAQADIEGAQGRQRTCTIGGRQMRFDVPGLSREEVQRTALAAYNAGCRALYWEVKAGNADRGTTGGDYSADTLARAAHFRRLRGVA
ncbi:N-acetylmuramoyl-L-alanine amidase [Methylobacterium sp. NMS12]|uniref:N-acetylmuramoyl-L-alanine amidase n=1 Tax=Methylobacterium sp. NMS12 TaxID=3079766 RepID=UPI003F880C25